MLNPIATESEFEGETIPSSLGAVDFGLLDAFSGSLAYVHDNCLWAHREHRGVRRSHLFLAFAHAVQDLRSVLRICDRTYQFEHDGRSIRLMRHSTFASRICHSTVAGSSRLVWKGFGFALSSKSRMEVLN